MTHTSIGKILIVDDEVELKNTLVEALASRGYETSGFTSGEAALAAFRTEAFDVLLTDLMMPGMDGIALVGEALKIDPHVVALVMTGQGTIQTAVDAMKVGAFDYVLKPFRLQTVMPVLTRAMNTRHIRLENLQLRETVAIYELSQTIAFTLDRQTIVSKLADAALQQTDADEVSILFPTEDGDELYVAAVRGENRQKLLGERVSLQESISSWVVHERTPLILDGEINDERFRALWPRPEIRSAISIPMQVANKLVGTININALNRVRPFTLGQMKALTILASTAAAALESASLYGQVKQAEENYRSIFENAVEGIFQSTPEGRFITVNPAMARILGYDSAEEMIETITDIPQQLYVNLADWVAATRLQEDRGKIIGFEFQALRKDGQTIWLSSNRRSVYDANGRELYREGTVEDITERKRTEEALKSSEAEMSALFASMTDLILVLDSEGRYLKVAPTKTHNIYRRDAVRIGKTLHEIFPRETADLFLNEIRSALETGSTRRIEYSLTIGDGDFWFDGSISPMSADSVVWVARDITERKHALGALEKSETRFRMVAENLGEGIFITGLDDLILYVNSRMAELIGYTREELLGTYAYKLLMPAEEWPAFLLHNTRRAEGQPERYELHVMRKDGIRIWLEVNAAPYRNLAGEIVGTVAANTDITERKHAEEALRESEERYRDLVENAHDIIYSHDLQGNYTSINKAGEVITGYTVEEALKLNLSDSVTPESLPKAREMIRRKLAGEHVTAYEIDILAKDGRRVTVEANTKLVYQDGVPVGVQGIARDISDRKQLEDQLRQSQKMEAIGQLAGGVAHDFNNLLTAIIGYSGLALQRIEDESPLKPYIEEIKKAGDRAANLTRQLLAFGRKQILQPLPLNLNDVITDLNKMLRRLIGEDIRLAARLDLDLKKIKADPGQIEQVLMNLVVNARDAMPRGGNLTIETANIQIDEEYAGRHIGVNSGGYVMLAVSDNGTGMDQETEAKIFEPFFTTKETGKGTGLGLSTVYGIVKQSGGNIWVYSEPGHGTTFKIYLPQVDDLVTTAQAKPEDDSIPGGSETVLLVEDEDVVRGLAQRILEAAGYRVITANGGEEAVTWCANNAETIHLLLTDVVMPDTSGKELAERLTSLRPQTKVLFMSGYTDEAIVHHGVLDSNVEFLQKPFTPTALSRKVRQVLDSNGLKLSSGEN